jgi:dienelactone hydrolase
MTSSEILLGGLDCFVASPPSDAAVFHKDRAIVFATDIFGWQLNEAREIAQRVANASNCRVFIPDIILNGDALKTTFDRSELGPWFERHSDQQTPPLLAQAINGLRKDEGVKVVIASGFCWGGRYSLLASYGESPIIDGFAVAHPSRTVAADYASANTPGLFLLAETDSSFPAEVVAEVKTLCTEKDFTFCGPFPGTTHGYAIRGSDEDALVAAARSESVNQLAKFMEYVASKAGQGKNSHE